MKKLTLIFMAFLLVLLSTTLVFAFPADVTIVYTFDNNTNTNVNSLVDEKGLSNCTNAIGTGGLTSLAGKRNQSYYFDGTTELNCTNSFLNGRPMNNTNFTMSFWIRTNNTRTYTFFWQHQVVGNSVYFGNNWVTAANMELGFIADNNYASPVVNSGNWNNYVVVVNVTNFVKTNSLHLYQNGVEVFVGNINNDLLYTSLYFLGGQNAFAAHARSLIGYFDEIYFFNRSLNSSEVLELNSTFWTPTPAPIVQTINITQLYISPNPAYDSDIITCYVNATGYNNTMVAYVDWYNNSVLYKNQSITINNATLSTLSNINAVNTTVTENWTCRVRVGIDTTYSDYLNTSVKIYGLSFNYAVPPNMDVSSLWTNPLLVYYRYADSDIVPGSFLIKHKTNTSDDDDTYYINGVAYSGWINNTRITNTSINLTGTLHENEILPGTYNLDSFLMINTTHTSATLSGSNVRLYIYLKNLVKYKTNSFIEFMINATASTSSGMTIRYCNSSFNATTSGDPVGNINCGICGSIAATTGYNHSHSNYSKHNLITINATNSKLCGVNNTGAGYFVFTVPSNINGWTYSYYPNFSIPGAFLSSNNGGNTVSEISGILDMHVHQYNNNSVYYGYVQYTKANGTIIESPIRMDTLESIQLPPTSPEIIMPLNLTYGGLVSINWLPSESNLGTISRYVGKLVYSNNDSVKKQLFNVTNSTFTYSECGYNLTDGSYNVVITTYDNLGQTSIGISNTFTINSTITTTIDPASSPIHSYVKNLYYGCHITAAPDVIGTIVIKRRMFWNCALNAFQWGTGLIGSSGYHNYSIDYTCDTLAGAYYNCDFQSFSPADTCNYIYQNKGNIDYYVNGVPPTASITTPTATNYYTASLPYNLTMVYNGYDLFLDSCAYNLDSAGFVNIPSCNNISINVTTYGSHTLIIQANDSGNLKGNATVIFNVLSAPALTSNYSNYFEINGSDYVRELGYNVLYSCNQTNILKRYINSVNDANFTPICDDIVRSYNDTYRHSVEGTYTIYFAYQNGTTLPTNTTTFISDLIAPTITNVSINLIGGFLTTIANLSLICDDTITPILNYNLTFNDVVTFNYNRTKGEMQSNTTSIFNYGLNTLVGTCSDPFNKTKLNVTKTVYSSIVYLIDEVSNIPFDVNNLSKVRLYRDDNSTYYDFKLYNVSQVSITLIGNEKLRLELTYTDNTVITRYVDASLLSNSTMRLCANLAGTTHYEQLILSATKTPVLLKSDYANCYVAADYTRFAYQSGYLLKAFTIARGYSLYLFTNGVSSYLASIDGSLASYVNLDSIKFSSQPFIVNTQGESLTFNKLGNGTIYIYYQNGKANLREINVTIREMDTGAIVYSEDIYTDINKFGFVFNYSAHGNASTFYTIKVEKTDTSGYITSITRYFNGSAFSRALRGEFAVVMAIFILIAGLTIAGTNTTFGWLGGLASFGVVAFLALAIPTWYVLFVQVMAALIGLYLMVVPFITKKVQLV